MREAAEGAGSPDRREPLLSAQIRKTHFFDRAELETPAVRTASIQNFDLTDVY